MGSGSQRLFGLSRRKFAGFFGFHLSWQRVSVTDFILMDCPVAVCVWRRTWRKGLSDTVQWQGRDRSKQRFVHDNSVRFQHESTPSHLRRHCSDHAQRRPGRHVELQCQRSAVRLIDLLGELGRYRHPVSCHGGQQLHPDRDFLSLVCQSWHIHGDLHGHGQRRLHVNVELDGAGGECDDAAIFNQSASHHHPRSLGYQHYRDDTVECGHLRHQLHPDRQQCDDRRHERRYGRLQCRQPLVWRINDHLHAPVHLVSRESFDHCQKCERLEQSCDIQSQSRSHRSRNQLHNAFVGVSRRFSDHPRQQLHGRHRQLRVRRQRE